MRNEETTRSQERRVSAIYNSLGGEISRALKADTTEEIRLNPDGRIWVVDQEKGTYDTGARLSAAEATSVIRLMASAADTVVTDKNPLVAGELPGTGERFQGVLPPVATAPFFVIRKPARTRWTLDDYVKMGSATEQQIAKIRKIISHPNPLNTFVIGGTFTGKTTFGNAMLAEPAFVNDRCALIEDNRELNLTGTDVLRMKTNEFVNASELTRVALRLSPTRIINSEVRGSEVWPLIQLWNTGHVGGFCTMHANTVESALTRIEDLIGEVTSRVPRNSIIAAIGAIIEVKFQDNKRVIGDIVTIKGYDRQAGEYITEAL